MQVGAVEIHRYSPEDFLLVFNDAEVASRVLHSDQLRNGAFKLTFRRWRRQVGAELDTLVYKVLLAMDNIPPHAWSRDTAQTIVGTSCLILQLCPQTSSKADMSRFMAVAWCINLDSIPVEVECYVPESEEPFVERAPPLFLSAEELIHTHHDTLRFRVAVHVLEVQDFHPRSDSSDEEGFWGCRHDEDSDDSDDDYPGFDDCGGSSKPWPRVHKFSLPGPNVGASRLASPVEGRSGSAHGQS